MSRLTFFGINGLENESDLRGISVTATGNCDNQAAKKTFVKPELRVLDVKGTETGMTPDPTEFDPFLNMS